MAKQKKRGTRASKTPAKSVPIGAGRVTVGGRGRTLDPRDAITIRNNADGLVAQVKGARPKLSDFLPGDDNAALRANIAQTGTYRRAGSNTEVRIGTRSIGNGEHEILSMAAVSRNPGTTQELIDAFDDFQFLAPRDKTTEVRQMWTIYNNDGLVNTSVNKIAALMATGGRFKVRHAKKGKKQKAREELQGLLDEVNDNVNNSPLDGVITGARGLKMVTQQAVRQCLVEGDWIGRTVWMKHEVRNLGSFSLPMVIQSVSMANMLPINEIASTGIEAWYWKPDNALVQQLTQPKDPIVRDLLKRYVDSKTLAELKKNQKVYLDPSLLMHVKHRGVNNQPYGESFIKPALYAIAYKRAVEQLDLVVINSLINRLTVVMVGNSDSQSPYADPQVASARQALMQSFFDDPGPNMTIIWQGDDVKIQDVGAHTTVLDLDGRHHIGDTMKKTAFGVPDALITGSSADGKSSAFASLLSAGSTLDETQSGFEQVFTTLGQRIADENGFVDAEIVYEFDNSMMIDRTEERNQARMDYVAGAMSIRSLIAARGQDPDAEFRQVCIEKGFDPETTLWGDAFMPPQGLPGQGTDGTTPPGAPGQQNRNPGGGRTPDNVQGKPAKPPVEKKTPIENK